MFGLFDRETPNINTTILSMNGMPDAVLVDVRSPGEFAQGHIDGSINIPVDEPDKLASKVPNKDSLLYVYCLSGARSARACKKFKQMGYSSAVNLGGLNKWNGALKKESTEKK